MTTVRFCLFCPVYRSVSLALSNEETGSNFRDVPRHVAVCRLARGTAAQRSDQSTWPERGPSLGALVWKLSVGIEKRRLAQDGESEPGREILFRLRLERWRRRPGDADQIRAGGSAEWHHPRRSRPAGRRHQDQ